MWEKVCKATELPVGVSRSFEKDKKKIGVYHTEDGLFAIHNVCPHHQTELHEGEVKDGMVYCPWHMWPFSLKDGKCGLHDKFNIPYFPIKLEDDHVWVNPSEAQTLGK